MSVRDDELMSQSKAIFRLKPKPWLSGAWLDNNLEENLSSDLIQEELTLKGMHIQINGIWI